MQVDCLKKNLKKFLDLTTGDRLEDFDDIKNTDYASEYYIRDKNLIKYIKMDSPLCKKTLEEMKITKDEAIKYLVNMKY